MYSSTNSLILLAIINLLLCSVGSDMSCPLFTVEFCCFAIYDIDGSINYWLCERLSDDNADSCDTELGLHPKCCRDNILHLDALSHQEIFEPDECDDPPPRRSFSPNDNIVPSGLCLDCDLSIPRVQPWAPAPPAPPSWCKSHRKKRAITERDNGYEVETPNGLIPVPGNENDESLTGFDICSL